jgi:hypothetical protein
MFLTRASRAVASVRGDQGAPLPYSSLTALPTISMLRRRAPSRVPRSGRCYRPVQSSSTPDPAVPSIHSNALTRPGLAMRNRRGAMVRREFARRVVPAAACVISLLALAFGAARLAAATPGPCDAAGVAIAQTYRVGAHRTFDRVVFSFTGGVPGWQNSAGYVTQVHADGSGLPIALEGSAFLQIMFFPARAYGATCHPTAAERTTAPHLPVLLQIKPVGDFEGYVSYGLGLARKTSYHLFALKHPDRVVLDIAH